MPKTLMLRGPKLGLAFLPEALRQAISDFLTPRIRRLCQHPLAAAIKELLFRAELPCQLVVYSAAEHRRWRRAGCPAADRPRPLWPMEIGPGRVAKRRRTMGSASSFGGSQDGPGFGGA
jgi:hypothetical protein